jgi:4a-hydroxytetrahydrobiopterin dehydratase
LAADLDPTRLASARCREIDPSTPSLTSDEAAGLATGLDPAWVVGADRLVRRLRFGTFGAAFGLATRVALLAEAQGHHPTLEVGWGSLTITWTTDSIGGLSTNDFVMAAKVDRLVERGLALKD